MERRIRRARELLEQTDLSVSAVCFEVGFESLGSFVARFRQLVGEPPVGTRPPPGEPPMIKGAGAFETEDCRKTYEELKVRGVEFLSPPKGRPYGIEAAFRDASANWFSLTQR